MCYIFVNFFSFSFFQFFFFCIIFVVCCVYVVLIKWTSMVKNTQIAIQKPINNIEFTTVGIGQLSSSSMRRDYYRGSQDSLAIRGKFTDSHNYNQNHLFCLPIFIILFTRFFFASLFWFDHFILIINFIHVKKISKNYWQ